MPDLRGARMQPRCRRDRFACTVAAMRSNLILLSISALLVVPSAVSAATPVPHVKFSGWVVTAGSHKRHVKPGGTLHTCAAVKALKATGKSSGRRKGVSYVEEWAHDGKVQAKFTDRWAGSGGASGTWTLKAGRNPFEPGTWRLRLIDRHHGGKHGKVVGRISFTIACSAVGTP